ncbi:MAG: hypothetical protein ABJA64_03195 [Candidatus Saccharibacteria bacterium]
MSEKLKSLVFVSLDVSRVGTEKEDLPLHVTMVPPFFRVNPDRNEALSESLHQAFKDLKSFAITGLEDATYGPDEDIPVRKVGGSVLYIVHDMIMPIAARFDRQIDTTYTGKNYSPHATYIGDRNIKHDERRNIKSLFLAQKTKAEAPSNWRILEEYHLGESNVEWQ